MESSEKPPGQPADVETSEHRPARDEQAPAEPQPYEFYLNPQSFFWGTPQRVRETMHQAIEETGAKRIMCWFDHGGMDAEALTHSLQLFADKVMPHFK